MWSTPTTGSGESSSPSVEHFDLDTHEERESRPRAKIVDRIDHVGYPCCRSSGVVHQAHRAQPGGFGRSDVLEQRALCVVRERRVDLIVLVEAQPGHVATGAGEETIASTASTMLAR